MDTIALLLRDPDALQRAQKAENSLQAFCHMTAVSERQIVDERRVARWPRIMVKGGVGWREEKDGQEVLWQVLLPTPLCQEALEQIHNHLWAGHQRARNTHESLERLYF